MLNILGCFITLLHKTNMNLLKACVDATNELLKISNLLIMVCTVL